MNYTGRISPGTSDSESVRFDFDSLPDHSHTATFKVPDAHLLFSGDYQRSGSDLVISDHLHRVIVPDYFHSDKRPLLVSPEGAPLDARVIDALTGYTHYAQAGGANAAGKVVGHVAKMTGSASIVRNGVTIALNNGDAVYQTDLVQTGSNSTLGLVLVDGTTFNLTANARLMLNDLTYDPTSTSNTSLFTLVQGAASFVAGQVAKTGDMKVGTPVAAIGVRGTSVILDISSTDGTVSISVVDQQDGQIHAVQVFNTRGDVIGTVTSNGNSLTLTPTANFDVIARESNKSPAQVAQEFNVFQQVLSTYDAFKVIAPNTPPPSDGKRGDANPQSTTKYASAGSSTPPPDTNSAQIIPTSASAQHQDAEPETTVVVTPASSASGSSTQPTNLVQALIIPALPPTVAITSSAVAGNFINQSAVSAGFTISGTASIGNLPVNGQTATVAIVDSSNVVKYTYTTTVANGVWSVNVTAAQAHALVDGSYSIQATVSDTSGNTATTVIQTITVDTVPPTVTISTTDTTTNQPTQTISGHVTATEAAAGATVTLFDTVNGVTTQVGTAAVGSGGAWSTSVTLSGNGTHSIVAQDTDAAGNTGASTPVTFALNTAGPSTSIAVPVAGDNIINKAEAAAGVAIGGTATAGSSGAAVDGQTATITIVDSTNTVKDTYTTTVAAGAWSVTVTATDAQGLADGSYSIKANVSDAAGNAATTATQAITVDETAPTIAITSPVAGDNIINKVEAAAGVIVSGTATAGSAAVNGQTATITIVDSTNAVKDTYTTTVTGGAWSVNVTAAQAQGLADGSYSIKADVLDAAGNAATTVSQAVAVETLPPTVTISTASATTNQSTQTISGTVAATEAAAGSTVTLFDTINGVTTQIGTATVVGGAWSNNVTLPGNGNHSIVAQDTDAAGNIGSSTPVVFTLATVAPTIAIASPVAGDNIVNKTEAAAGVTISGTAVAGTGGAAVNGQTATITIVDNTNTVKDTYTTTVTAGAWSVNVTAAQAQGLTDGSYSIKADVSDAVGNAATTATQAITVDETAPTIAITSPVAGDNIINKAEAAAGVTISGTVVAGSAAVNGQTATITIVDSTNAVKDAYTVTVTGGAWSVNVAAAQALADGSYSIKANLSDAAGNAATTASQVITVDATAPTIAITSPVAGDNIVNKSEAAAGFTISGTTTAGSAAVDGQTATITIIDNTSAVRDIYTATVTGGVWSVNVTAAQAQGLADGSYTIKANVADIAGNSAITASQAITVDETSPTIAITSPVSGDNVVNKTEAAAGVTISGTATAGIGGAAVDGQTATITIVDSTNTVKDTYATTVTAGAWSVNVTAAQAQGLADGSYSIKANVSDAAGNAAATASLTVTVDETAPTIAITSPIAGDNIINKTEAAAGITINGTAAAGTGGAAVDGQTATITIVDSTNTVKDTYTTMVTAGAWSVNVTAAQAQGLADGSYSIKANLSDAAGNAATPASQAIAVETLPPTVLIGTTGTTTNQVSQTISGTLTTTEAAAGSTVVLFDTVNNVTTQIGSATVVGGSWSTSVTLSGNGTHSIVAQDTDAAGNIGSSTPVVFTLATVAPTIAITSPIAGDNIINKTEAAAGVIVSGTAAAGSGGAAVNGQTATITVVDSTDTVKDTYTATVTAGTWSVNVTAAQAQGLADGSYSVKANVSDAAGNAATTASQAITVDESAPAIAITSPIAADNIINKTEAAAGVAISGTATAGAGGAAINGQTATITIVDGTNTVKDTYTTTVTAGAWSINVTAVQAQGLADGSYSIKANVSDAAGNAATTASQAITVDETAPTIAITSPIAADNIINKTEAAAGVAISGTAVPGAGGAAVNGQTATITIVDGTNTVNDTYTTTVTAGAWSVNVTAAQAQLLADGSYSIKANVSDSAGNAATTASQAITVDETAPTIAITSPVAGDNIISRSEAAAGVAISGTATAGSAGVNGQTATITIVDGTNTVKDTYTATVTAGTWSVNVTALQAQALADGSYSIKANVSDAAGNAATTATQAITVDETSPTIAITSPVAGDNIINKSEAAAGVAISGTATAGSGGAAVNGQTATITIVDGTNTIKDTYTATVTGGTWSVNVTALQAQALADGSYSIKANVSDSAGNAATTATQAIAVDETAPSGGTPVLTVASDSGTSHTDGITNVTAPTFTVALNSTVAAGDTVQLLLAGSALAHPVTHTVTAADVTAGSISLTVTAGDLGADGSKLITARFTDAAGNSSTTSVLGLTLDTAAPAKPATAADAAVINGVVNAANDTASQALTGTAEGSSTVTVFDNGVQVATALAAANGSWSYVIGVLANGSSHSYTVTATDAAGNTSAASDPLAFTVDTSGPSEPLAIAAVAGSSLANNTTITVSGTNGTLSAGQKIQVSSDGGSTWIDAVRNTGGSWSFVDPLSHAANFAYWARIIDTIGNSSAVATQAVIVASAGATVSLAGSPPFIAEFTGIGGNLALGSSAITSTVDAISIASGAVGIVGGASVTTSAGDGIDLAANGGTQASPSNIGVAPTGAVTGAATGISVVQNGVGAIGVVTLSPVTGLAGRGILAEQSVTGIGSIVISGSGNVTGTGDAFSGIVAENLDTADSSSVAVSTTGNVTGGYDGIRAVTNGSGNVIVTTGANATIAGRLRYGIEATSNGTGSINVTMAAVVGDVITSGSVGINAYNQATALPQISGVTSSSIAVTAYGTINSGDLLTGSSSRPAGILAGYRGGTTNTVNPAVYGNVTVDNFANINAAGGDGIRAYNFGNGTVTVTDHANTTIVTRDQFGIDAQTNGTGQVTVTTAAGDIINSGSYGIQAINLATLVPVAAASSVNVTARGTIHAGFHLSPGAGQNQGVSAGYYPNNGTSDTSVNGTVSIDNFANVTSDNGWGVNAYNWGNGSVTLTDEAGTFVSGMQYGLSGFSGSTGAGSSGSVTINVLANATITAGAAINAAGINANERNAGNITITTATGDTINSGGFGINAGNQATSANSSSQISITVRGTINSGFSGFSAAGINAGYNGGSGSVNTSVAGNVIVDDFAAINAASGYGISLYNFGTGSLSATVEAGATVAAATAGLNAYAQGGGNVTIANSGIVTAATGNGINVGTGTGSAGNGLPGSATGHGAISITNAGAVTGLGAANSAVVQVNNFSANAATFSNSGTVTANMLSSGLSVAISVYSGPITTNTGGVTINNNSGGTISGNVVLSPNFLVSTSTFNNATGAIWNVNGTNWFGSATSAINNFGTINIAGNSGFYAVVPGAALAFNNFGTVEILSGGYGYVGGAVTGGTAPTHGSFQIDDRAALEFTNSVISTQTVSFADGRGLLRLDSPGTFAGTISGLAVGDIIDFAGSIIVSSASIAGSTLTVTESNAATLAYTVANVEANTSANFDVLSTDKIVALPTQSASNDVFTVTGLLNTTYVAGGPVTKSTTYIFSGDTITGTTTGININASAETTATDTITALVNQTSLVSVTGANVSGIVAATGGASIAVVNAANVTSAGGIGVFANNGAAGNGSIDIVDYGNVSGGTAGIQAQAAGTGPINILVGAGAAVTGAVASNTSSGILAISKLGSASVTTLPGSTISSGRSGIFVENQSTSVPLLSGARTSIVVTTSGAINSGQAGTTPATGEPGGIVAGYLGNATGQPSIPNPPLTGIFGDVVVNNNAAITAARGMGIDAFNYGTGDVSVSNSSTITATAAGSTASGFTQYGIFAFNYGIGNTSVATASSSSIVSGGTGINAGNQATVIAAAASSTLTVDSLGTIHSGANLNNSGSAPSGIQAGYNPGNLGVYNSGVSGNVLVVDGGNITADAGEGINAYNFGNGNVAVNVGFGVTITALIAASAGSKAPYGIGAAAWGPGNISVITSGADIINSGSSGINAVNEATAIAAGVDALVTVNSFGTINFGGIATNSGGNPSGVSAGYLGGNAAAANMDVNGTVIVNNSANIAATVFNGVAVSGIGINAFNFGNGDITVNDNSGTTVSGVQNGIDAHAEGGTGGNTPTGNVSVNVAANATVISTASNGILAFSTDVGNISVVTSSGDVITAGSAGINAVNEQANILPSANSWISVTAAGTINSGTALTGTGREPAGILAGYLGGSVIPTNLPINVNGEVVVNNSANINAAGGDGIRAYNYGIGNVTVNQFAGTITALDASSLVPAGYGIGIAANNYGSGDIYINMSAGTINAGGSGISALNRAVSTASLPSVPSTSIVSVLAFGTINSGPITTDTNTAVKDPAAGILAGYDPGNSDTIDANIHGNVVVDDHASILAAAGADGIRAVNYGTFDANGLGGTVTVTVEAGAVISAGRYGVAALGFGGGNVTVTNNGTIMATTDAVDAMTTSTGTVVLDNAGYLGGNVISYNATFTNELSAIWSLNGQNVFTGASTLSNAGVIDSQGTSVISGLSGITNTGLIEVLSGSLVLSEPVGGAGTAIVYSAALEFGGASDANVQFATSTTATSGTLVLDDVAHFAGTVTGFTSGDTIDLVGISPANVSITNAGSLLVNYGTGSFGLIGNYSPTGFSIVSDGHAGTDIIWDHQAPVISTSTLTVTQNGNGTTTITGLQVSDLDAAAPTETFTMTATTGAAGSGTTVSPSTGSGLLTAINTELATGITYNPGATPPSTDKVALTVTDGFGATDTVNFVFSLASSPTAPVTLTGTSGKDVIFATGNNDTLTGGGGADQFVFNKTTGAHTIADFSTINDHIDLTALSSIVTAATLNTWLASNVATSTTNPADTVISLGSNETITLHNVLAANVHASDFIVHA